MNKQLSKPTRDGLSKVVRQSLLDLEIINGKYNPMMNLILDEPDAFDILCKVDSYFEPRMGDRKAPDVYVQDIVRCETPEAIIDTYWSAYDESKKHKDSAIVSWWR
jgi:hypothetical protein|tara:strand:+ start:320 stop:637 length:318 start_codon:yes stop_codon:yes gene_type:complete